MKKKEAETLAKNLALWAARLRADRFPSSGHVIKQRRKALDEEIFQTFKEAFRKEYPDLSAKVAENFAAAIVGKKVDAIKRQITRTKTQRRKRTKD